MTLAGADEEHQWWSCAAVPIYIPFECGCRIQLTAENSGSHEQCKCGNPVFVPYDVCFRFHSPLELTTVFETFREWFPVSERDFTHDAENVWEWFDGRSSDGRVGFNISRKHNSRYLAKSNPVIMSILLHDVRLTPELMGQRMAASFATRVVATSPSHKYDATYEAT